MEFHNYHGNPFQASPPDSLDDPFSRNQRCPSMPVETRLKENKERRLIIEKEKQREKQFILEKRKQKQENVQKILKERQEARENAKLVFGNMQKTFSNKFQDQYWRKAEDIEEKIHECRTRADQYRTMYRKKIQDTRQDRERNVRIRKDMKDREEKDRSLNHHLAEWRSYEKKIADKYRGEAKNPNRMYEELARRQDELKELMDRHRETENQRLSAPIDTGHKEIKIKLIEDSRPDTTEQKQRNNPVYSTLQISSFGLQKSIKNPEKIIKDLKFFLQSHTMVEDPCQDQALLSKFEEYLDGKSKSQ